MAGHHKFYGKYKNVRNAAWNVIVDFKINSLPVSLTDIAKVMGVNVLSYKDGNGLIDFWELKNLCELNDGFTTRIADDLYIFFDNTVSRTRARMTIAHELAHILLGHELKVKRAANVVIEYTEENVVRQRKSVPETEADMVALRLLAPACVLWGLDIQSAEDIAVICNIPIAEAKARARRMELLYMRNRFLTSKLEKKVFAQFKNFIEANKNKF